MTRDTHASLPQLLLDRALRTPDRVALTVLGNGEEVTAEVTYRALWARAQAIAAVIGAQAPVGSRALVLHGNDDHYLAAFLGCLAAGIIAVPAFPPDPSRPQQLDRVRGIIRDARPWLILTSERFAPLVRAAIPQLVPDGGTIEVIATDAFAPADAAAWMAPAASPDDVAFLQYTSGSTGSPRGVMVSHTNILANERAIQAAFGIVEADVLVSWLPLYHDMGLIGAVLQTLYSGARLVLLAPEHFVTSPMRWLRAIARFGGTVSGAPDFAYRLCLDRITQDQIDQLALEIQHGGRDLSSWQVAFCGAEPIRAETLTAFAEAFAPLGFRAAALYPCYGLAEATLLVTGGTRGTGATIARFDHDAFAAGRAVASDTGRAVVGCGQVARDHAVVVVDPGTGVAVEPGQVGEILVQGASITAGYWNQPLATADAIVRRPDGPAVRTGDLGFQHAGQLYITGRRKDLLIIRGQNLYPQDVERTIGREVDVLREGRIAVFAVDGPAGETIGVAAELGRRIQKLVQPEALCTAIREAVAEAHGDPPAVILLLESGTLPITSSGKLRRSECLRAWRAGTLKPFAVFERGALRGLDEPALSGGARAPGDGSPSASPEGPPAASSFDQVAAIVREVLGVARVRPGDSFFALGGSSLAGMQLVARLTREFGVALDPRGLFSTSLGALARELDDRRARGEAAQPAHIPIVARGGQLPLSPGEQRLWFLHQLDPDSTAYHLAGAMRITGRLDRDALAGAFTALVARHEVLWTTFGQDDGRPVRVIGAPWAVELPVVEVSRDEVARVLAHEASRPFDLVRDRLLRATLVRVGDDEHVLLAVIHHIAADSASMDVLRRELATGYAAIASGSRSAGPALPIQVADYAAWHDAWRSSDDRAHQLAYWGARLSGERAALPLPRSRAPRTGAPRLDAQHRFVLDAALADRLRGVARDHATSLYSVLLGGLQVLLHRYTGHDDLWIGAPIANRRPETARLIGFFVNTCVLRTRIAPRASFADHLARVHDTVAGALAHADVAFQHVLERVGAERELDQQALFQVMYNHLAPEYTAPFAAGGIVFGTIERASYAADFDLVLDTAELATASSAAIEAVFSYRADRIDREAVERLATHYAALLAALAADPRAPIDRVPLLGAEEACVIDAWTGATESARWDREGGELSGVPVHETIARRAAETPDAIAVQLGDATLCYAALDARADRWARALRAHGVGPDVLVAICAEPTFELVIGLVAVLKAGGAFLALDPSYPSKRLAVMLRDARPRVVLVADHLRALVDAAETTVLSFAGEPALDDGGAMPVDVRPDHLAYCIYTSGSTGVPKAALLTHGGLANHLDWMWRAFPAGAADRVLQCAPSGFDAAVCELFLPLVTGGACVFAARDDTRDPARLIDQLARHRITLFITVPSLLELVVDTAGGSTALAQLRCLGSGGEALTARLAARLIALPDVAVFNLYGPTETTIDATAWRLTADDLGGDAPIGRPIRNATAHVLDRALNPVPAGGVGELYVGGTGLARGYLHRPGTTAERFVPDPFARTPGARLYRTGDLVRRRADGAIEYLERADRQIKLHGHRIELGEITARLAAEPEVRQATVEIRHDAGVKQLVAYVVRAPDAPPEATLRESLPERLARVLPSRMVPRVFVFLDALPTTPSGKLDRAALPAPDLSAAQAEYAAPRTAAEQTLAAIWQAVLQLPRVGLHDNFFQLGGDSIAAIQVVGKARAAGLSISPPDVFRHQTIESLARVAVAIGDLAVRDLDKPAGRFPLARLTDDQLAQVPVALDLIDDILPLTPMQEGMLLHTLLEPGSGIYLMQDQYRFYSAIDPAAFLAAWDHVVARHAALRASFWQLGDKTLQIIHREIPPCTEYVDLRGVAPDEQDRRIAEALAGERRRGFDFAVAPLVRLRLFRLGDDAYAYVESHHHILMDDWCRSLLFLDFFAAYDALREGRSAPCAPVPHYGAFIAWLDRQDRGRARAHWTGALAGFDAATPLAIDRPLAADPGPSQVASALVELSEHDAAQIAETARRLRLTVNTLAQGAWAATLARYAGTPDVVFGVTVAGRSADVPGVQDMVGLFVNTIPLRARLPAPGSPTTIADWLIALQDQSVGHRLYEHVSLVEIQACTAVPRGHELFHSLLVFENAPLDPSLRTRAAELQFRLADNRTHTNYPITAVVIPGERIRLVLSYDERRFDADDIARMLGEFARSLRAIAAQPELPVRALSALSADEHHRIVHDWNATASDHALDIGFAARFAARATASPDAIAARQLGAELRYRDLAARAHRVGWALRSRGVAIGDRVGVFAERGLDQLALVVGVLAAGAVYVPLDVRHPADRIAHIARASGARVVLVTAGPRAPLGNALASLTDRPAILALPDVLAGDLRDDPLELPSHPDQLAYVIYTSGSTGSPKGAMVTLAGMLNNQLSKIPLFGLTERDVIAQTAAPSFDISVWQLLTGLLCGAVIDFVPDDVVGDPPALLRHVRTAGVTLLELVPAVIHELLREPHADLPALRFLLPTGEALTPELARLWLRRYPHVPLVNAYGPAECADDVALARIDTPPAAGVLRMPIGRPTDNTRLYVLDGNLAPLPVGVIGQLAVAGIGVGHGYLADPAHTAAAFVPHPLGRPGERIYLTGDLARFRPDGTLEYVGRADQQVKLRGHRLELGEIEARLIEQPGVVAAAVLLRHDTPGQPRLVAYLVAAPDAPSTLLESLRARLTAVLPAVMVPSVFVALDALPWSANGKLDRRALPAPDLADAQRPYLADAQRPYLAPRTPLEAHLARIVAATAPTTAAPAITPVDRGRPLPLSFAQERQWFLWRLEPNSTAYHIPMAAKLVGRLDLDALSAAFAALVTRHDTLRTRFVDHAGDICQVVDPDLPLAIPHEDLRALGGDTHDRIDAAIADAIARPFDLTRGPLWRAAIYQLADDAHALIVVMHHIVADEVSLRILIDELAVLYAAQRAGEPAVLPALAIHYADYAAWQRSWLTGGELERQLAYWKDHLGTDHPVIELPTDRTRPAVASGRGALVELAFDAELTAGLRRLARAHDATLFMVLLAAFDVLLYRITGQTDLRVGVPNANRNRVELERLIGFFINTHVLRTEVAPAQRFTALLAQVKRTALAAQAHQDLPFEQLVEALSPPRSLSHGPLFQVMFNFLWGERDRTTSLGDLRIDSLGHQRTTTQFDLALDTWEDGATVGGTLTYATDLFDARTIERLGACYQQLLRAICAEPDAPVATLAILAPDEQRALTIDRARGPELALDPRCVHEVIADQIRRTPAAVAVRHAGCDLTYAELGRRAARLARRLRQLGIGPDMLVGICLERSHHLVPSALGVLQAGGAYLPLDPDYPRDRIAYMLADARPAVLVTEAHLAARFAGEAQSAGAALCVIDLDLDSDGDDADGDSAAPPVTDSHPSHLAYSIYTSGSTGRPKGVTVSHAAIVNFLDAMQRELPLTATDRVLAITPISFDIAGLELFLPLVSGACVVIADRAEAMDPALLLARVRTDDVTLVQATPATWRMVAGDPRAAETLRQVRALCGGEALPPDLAAQLIAIAGGGLWNVYGPTETTVWSSIARLDAAHPAPVLGAPLRNTQLYLLDRFLQPVGFGVAGELYIGGDGLARGYWQRPALTAERFIPDPFAAPSSPGRRLYRTGDRVRRRSDGSLEFLGRVDHQIKLRGHRIELGEIEARLLADDRVRAAAVILREDAPGEPRLVAYVVPASGALDASALQVALREALPEFMVPDHFVELAALPRTANGKLDRKVLLAPDVRDAQARYAAPRTALEIQLARIWTDALGVDQVGLADHFFELGGHSLLATRVTSRILHELGVAVPLRTLFEASQLGAFAARVAAQLDSAAPASTALAIAPPIRPVDRSQPLPLSFAQERQWFLWQLDPEATAYHIPFAVQLTGALDPDTLAAAFTALAARHDVLRTRFVETAGTVHQVIAPARAIALPIEPLVEASVRVAIEVELSRPFDLVRGPLWRARLFRVADRAHVLLVVLHHAISDEASVRVLIDELGQLYACAPLAPLAIQYADYAAWQRGWLTGDELARQLAYWTAHLGTEHPVIELPTDRPRPAIASARGAACDLVLDAALTRSLDQLARGHDATLFMVLLAAFNALLYRLTGQTDLRVGVPVGNRNRVELERVLGFFVNTHVLRTEVAPALGFTRLLAQLKHAVLGAHAHAELPFEQLVDALKPPRSLGHSPLFQVMFNHLWEDRAHTVAHGDLQLAPIDLPHTTTQLDLALTTWTEGGALHAILTYATDLFDAQTIERVLGDYQRLLRSIVDAPDAPVARLAMLSGSARHALLVEHGEGPREPLDPRCLHARIAAQMARAPDAVAVRHAGRDLTYATLDTRARRLAVRLRQLGVDSDDRVGLCLERSEQLVVAALGILQAGGAYLPLDPDYPRDRLAYMLADARPRVLVTSAALAGRFADDARAAGAAIYVLDKPDDDGGDEGALPALPQRDHLAYCIYTSGSTGRPKGVTISHAAIVNFLDAMQRELPLTAADRVLAITPISFDIAGLELFLPLVSGACVVIADRAEAMDPALLLARVRTDDVTLVQATPATWRMVAGDPRAAETLRQVRALCGGEALPPDLAAQLIAIAGGGLWNVYGPTETTVWSSIARLDAAHPAPVLGAPLRNTQLYVLDRFLQPVGFGVAGELYIGGDGLARGYWQRPALTAERFVPDPFAAPSSPGRRLYRTGDRVRRRSDGSLEFLGRVDHQIKLRGHRIELGEIEAHLLALAEIAAAAVVLREDSPGDPRLVAYVVRTPDIAIDTTATADPFDIARIQAALRPSLPDFMIPSQLVELPALPRSPAGKLDRKALPAPDATRPRALVAPRDELERRLAALWQEVLDLDAVGVHDSFFDLGGHSLSATRLASRIRDALAIELPLRVLFEATSVAALADILRAGGFGAISNDEVDEMSDLLDLLENPE